VHFVKVDLLSLGVYQHVHASDAAAAEGSIDRHTSGLSPHVDLFGHGGRNLTVALRTLGAFTTLALLTALHVLGVEIEEILWAGQRLFQECRLRTFVADHRQRHFYNVMDGFLDDDAVIVMSSYFECIPKLRVGSGLTDADAGT